MLYFTPTGKGPVFNEMAQNKHLNILFLSVLAILALLINAGCQKSLARAKKEDLIKASGLVSKQDLPAAQTALKNILMRAPNDPDANLLYSRLLLLRGQARAAAEKLTKARAKNPDDVRIAAALGDALLESGNINAAQEQYEKVLETDPASVPAKIGMAAVNLAKYKKAEFQWAASRYPLESAKLLYDFGNKKAAIEEYKKIADPEGSIGPRGNASLILFRAYLEEGSPSLALDYLERAAGLVPERIGKEELTAAIEAAKKTGDKKREEMFRELLEQAGGSR